jgi:hypothetical protein
VARLVRSINGEIEVRCLLLGKDSKLDVELLKVRASNFLIELLGEHVDAEGELTRVGPEGNLGQNLVGEGARHNKGWVARSTSMKIN